MKRSLLLLVAATAVPVPAMLLRWGHQEVAPVTGIFVFGLGIVAAAFMISWAAELAQLEVSQTLAVVVVALLAVLPEYAVDLYFAWTAAWKPEYAPYALANMTGANRLLVGLGWPVIAFLHWLRTRGRVVELGPEGGGEVFFLALATVYSFLIPIKGSLELMDTLVLVVLFGLYVRFAARQEVEEPELMGPAALVAELHRGPRRLMNLLFFAWAGFGIFTCAEPFAESLVAAGGVLGINEFYLVQWVAPLASETPEFLVAALFVWKGLPTAGLGTLISSKVNQWSLLVGTVPLVYALGLKVAGKPLGPIPLDERQFGEILLTGAQSFLAVCVILNLRFSLANAFWLAVLFLAQLGVTIGIEESGRPDAALWLLWEKYFFSTLYLAIGVVYLFRYRRYLPTHLRSAFARPNAT